MEYVDGIDLAKLVKQNGRLPIVEACDYVRQAALGLQHAHECGLVHRDIKPSNLLLAVRSDRLQAVRASGPPEGGHYERAVVKLLDLGLARIEHVAGEESSNTLTESGAVLGTPDFIAPEQAKHSKQVDIRADLYSLGCTLYYLLTAQVPFPAETLGEKLLKHMLEEPIAVEAHRPDVPPGVAGIVRKLMAKHPGDRYQTPKELAEVLEIGLRTGKWPEAKASQAIQVAMPVFEQVSGKVPLAQPVGQTELASAASTGARWARAVDQPTADNMKAAPRKPGRRRRLVASAAAGLLLAALGVGYFLYRPAGVTVATNPSTPAKVVAPQPERFSWHPKELAAVLGDDRWRQWHPIRSVVVSPDGKVIASASANGTIRLWDAAAGDDGVRLWDLATGKQRAALPHLREKVVALAYSADGRALATATETKVIRLWDVATGKHSKDLTREHPKEILCIALSPDGKTLTLGSRGDAIRLLDVEAGKERAVLPVGEAWGVRYSPDGKSLVSYDRGAIHLWDTETNKERAKLGGVDSAGFTPPVFTPDSRLLFVGGNYAGVRQWETATGKPIPNANLAACTLARAIAPSPDGKLLATVGADGWVILWDVATSVKRQEWQLAGPVHSVAFSPDGKDLATGNGNGTVYILRLPAELAGK